MGGFAYIWLAQSKQVSVHQSLVSSGFIFGNFLKYAKSSFENFSRRKSKAILSSLPIFTVAFFQFSAKLCSTASKSHSTFLSVFHGFHGVAFDLSAAGNGAVLERVNVCLTAASTNIVSFLGLSTELSGVCRI